MSDLISRQAALDAIKERADVIDSVFSAFWEGLIIAHGIVAKIPSADAERTMGGLQPAEPYKTDDDDKRYHCGSCSTYVGKYWKYCAHCGAPISWEGIQDSDD